MLATHLKSSCARVAARSSRSLNVRVMAFQGGETLQGDNSVQTKQRVKTGDKLPFDQTVYVFRASENKPVPITLGEIFKGKKAVMFGLPGAYTSVCSNKHLPEYKSRKNELNDAGVELIACAAVNDAFVMDHWAKDRGVDPENEILMLGDGDASMHRALGLTQTIPGLGERSFRYSMYLEDGVIKVLNIEEPGGMSYKISGPSHMLGDLKKLHETGEPSEATTKAA